MERTWTDHTPELLFAASDHEGKDVHVRILGPREGHNFVAELTFDEMIALGVDLIAEARRRQRMAEARARERAVVAPPLRRPH